MNKFTPGPWQLRGSLGTGWEIFGEVKIGKDEHGGDSDLPNDNSEKMKAMQETAEVIEKVERNL